MEKKGNTNNCVKTISNVLLVVHGSKKNGPYHVIGATTLRQMSSVYFVAHVLKLHACSVEGSKFVVW